MIDFVARNTTPKLPRKQFCSNIKAGWSSDMDGPWSTVWMTYYPQPVGLGFELNQAMARLRCVHDLVATEAVSGHSNIKIRFLPCNLTMRCICSIGCRTLNIGTDYYVNSERRFKFSFNITGKPKSTVDNLASFDSTKHCPILSSKLPPISSTNHYPDGSNPFPFLKMPLLFSLISPWGDNAFSGDRYD